MLSKILLTRTSFLPSNLIVIFTERVEKSKDNNRGEDFSEDLE
jgi:hypothetical protein